MGGVTGRGWGNMSRKFGVACSGGAWRAGCVDVARRETGATVLNVVNGRRGL
jgi:hypothetical protein